MGSFHDFSTLQLQPGLTFVLVYQADIRSRIPNIAYKWMLQRGIPGFLSEVAIAAKKLSPERRRDALRRYSSPSHSAVHT